MDNKLVMILERSSENMKITEKNNDNYILEGIFTVFDEENDQFRLLTVQHDSIPGRQDSRRPLHDDAAGRDRGQHDPARLVGLKAVRRIRRRSS